MLILTLRRFQRMKIKKVIWIFIGLVSIYLFLSIKKHYVEKIETIILAPSKNVWEFIADFSNLQKLNPNIYDFMVESEKGNYENWEYSIKYQEASNQVPFLRYQNSITFKILPKMSSMSKAVVKGINHDRERPYRIYTDLVSCVIGYCLQGTQEIHFLEDEDDQTTQIIETINFDCPLLLSYLFFNDLKEQRRIIYDNLMGSVDVML